MKKIAFAVFHLVILCWAGIWFYNLAARQLPKSGSTVEQWRQKVEQINNVTELRNKLVLDQDYILRMEALLERLRKMTVMLAAVLTVYSLAALLRSFTRAQTVEKQTDSNAI